MRHRRSGRKLGRTSAHRKATLENLAASLIEHERIRTTLPKAKELRPFVERLVTLGKRQDLHARRIAASRLPKGSNLAKLFGALAERFAERPGGYTRILRAGFRYGDAAPMAVIEFVDYASDETEDLVPPPSATGESPKREKEAGKEDKRPWWQRLFGRGDRQR